MQMPITGKQKAGQKEKDRGSKGKGWMPVGIHPVGKQGNLV